MKYHSLNLRTRYIIKLQQHTIFHQKVAGNAATFLYDGFVDFKFLEQAYRKLSGQGIAI